MSGLFLANVGPENNASLLENKSKAPDSPYAG